MQLKAATLRGETVPFPKNLEGWPAVYLNLMRDGMTLKVRAERGSGAERERER